MSNHHSQRGYTLIELIVSVGIFSIVMLLASGAYLSLISYTREARAVSTVMTSLSYGIDQMSREIRTGTDYQCGTGGCANASSITVTNDQGHTVSYLLADGAIARCVDESVCTAAIAVPLTDPSIDVTSLVFNVKGNTSSSDGVQPYVTMTVRGEAAVAGESPVPFSIETSASQRTLDLGGSSGGSGGSGDDGGGDGGGGDGGGDTGDGMAATGGTVTQSGGYTIHTFTSGGALNVTHAGTVDVLVIGAGGGGGGGNSTQCVMGGGGGAGGYVYQTGVSLAAQSYTVVAGIHGAAGTGGFNVLSSGTSGTASTFDGISAAGGGGGGYGNCSGPGAAGSSGASGGGGGYGTGGTTSGGSGGTGGHNGAASQTGGTSGGGGGAGAAATSGVGGTGISNSISGTAVTYATGGQGNTTGLTAGVTSPDAAANTGNGGPGGWSASGGKGSNGIVIIRYPTP